MMSSRMASTPICRSCWSVLQAELTRISPCLDVTCKQLPQAGGTGGDAHLPALCRHWERSRRSSRVSCNSCGHTS